LNCWICVESLVACIGQAHTFTNVVQFDPGRPSQTGGNAAGIIALRFRLASQSAPTATTSGATTLLFTFLDDEICEQ
jgi:hypothetical protein